MKLLKGKYMSNSKSSQSQSLNKCVFYCIFSQSGDFSLLPCALDHCTATLRQTQLVPQDSDQCVQLAWKLQAFSHNLSSQIYFNPIKSRQEYKCARLSDEANQLCITGFSDAVLIESMEAFVLNASQRNSLSEKNKQCKAVLSLEAWNCCKLELLKFFGVMFKQQCLNARELEAKETIPSWIW